MRTFTTGDLAPLFKVNEQTIRRWSEEFRDYLSPHANPPTNKTRLFTEDDLQVLTLVNEMKNQKHEYKDIHAALANHQHEDVIVPELAGELSLVDSRTRYEMQIRNLQDELGTLRSELDTMRDENTRLKAELEASKREAELQHKIGFLEGKLAALEGKG